MQKGAHVRKAGLSILESTGVFTNNYLQLRWWLVASNHVLHFKPQLAYY